MFSQIWTFFVRIFDYLLQLLKTLPRDLRGVYKLIKHHIIIKYNIFRKQDFIYIFRKNVKYYQSKPCFIFEDTSLSFQQVCLFKNINIQNIFSFFF